MSAPPVSPDAIDVSIFERHKYAHDASHYLRVPAGIARPRDATEVAELMRRASRENLALTFRSGGTSLSGQAGTGGILVDTRAHFQGLRVLDRGTRVAVQPGVTLRRVNARLAASRRMLGPDPASEIACTIGGIVANNSSGMTCGTVANAYRTIESLVVVLPSGTVLDTARADAEDILRESEPELYAGLRELTERVRSNPESRATISRLFSMKNTMGYSLNAFLDFDRVLDVFTHLLIGSEGTLGFVADATFRTVESGRHVTTGLALFDSLDDAASALPDLVAAGFDVIELLDSNSLTVAQGDAEGLDALADLEVENHAALLLEFRCASAASLARKTATATATFDRLGIEPLYPLSENESHRAALWHVRKGLYATVAEHRPTGTTALLEDIAVPVASVAATCRELGRLFAKHGYESSVIFGHAKDGNLHFMLSEDFEDAASVARYERFTEDMVRLVLDAGGVLKAEHGTGVMMSGYLERQYGRELYEVIRAVKALFDPAGILGTGVIVNDDPRAYVENLKTNRPVEGEVDRCVECGYCEPGCPSRNLTLTPRQRITLRRDIAAARSRGDLDLVRELERPYGYEGVDTCAVDGICAVACPVNINTGDLVRRLRHENEGAVSGAAWNLASEHWGVAVEAARTTLNVAEVLPAPLVIAASKLGRAVLGDDTVPLYDPALSGGSTRRPRPAERAVAVYFPACVGSMFGPEDGVEASLRELCSRAGVEILVPDGIAGLCCGTPWKSKGHLEGLASMRNRVKETLWAATNGGELPVLVDASSCTQGLAASLGASPEDPRELTVVDAVRFARNEILPRLPITRKVSTLAVHHTCSSTELGTNADLLAIASAVSDSVYEPTDGGCCAFAGDRGLLHPELTAAATAPEAAELFGKEFEAYVSANRTCEIGMSRATGHDYRHILELLEAATRTSG